MLSSRGLCIFANIHIFFCLLHELLMVILNKITDNSCVNVDKRVRDISKNFESKPEPSVSRTPSFSKRNQKLEEKEKEKGPGKEEDKESEDSLKVSDGRRRRKSTKISSNFVKNFKFLKKYTAV